MKEAGSPSWASLDLQYWYFGSLCAFQQSGDTWRKWNEAMKKALIENQNKSDDDAGSWTMTGGADSYGKVGQTALCSLCLQTYYRYVRLSRSGNASSDPIRPATPQAQPVQTPGPTPAVAPAPTPAPAQPSVKHTNSDSGQEAIDYSEYIRKMKEGVEPTK